MHSKTPLAALLAVPALIVGAALGIAQIERLDLRQMVEPTRAENAVLGTITAKQVFRVDHPVDGPELYFTRMTIQGKSLYDGSDLTAEVTFAGGFVSPNEGVHNSEAPSADDTRIGNTVVAFYRWTNNMGGDVAGNALYAAHGGLFRVAKAGADQVVLGRGEGYAIARNVRVPVLEAEIRELRR
ncbi:MAG TPA: hypothetical protein VMS76_09995 [Planctomycetota bacterium]|nr:hypothetical protein [Planctomycetota bacterium]